MIHVLHLITDLSAGGAQTSLFRLVKSSDSQRFKHSVVSLTGDDALGREIREAGIPVNTLRMSRGIPSPLGCLRLAWLLRKLRPDILQCWLYHSNLLGLIAGRLAGIRRVIWGIHSSNPAREAYPMMTRWTIGLGAHLSSLTGSIVVVSEAGRKLHESWGFDAKKMTVIPNGVDTREYQPNREARISVREELGISADAILIGLTARFHPMKDHETFIKAARRLSESWPDTHFVLIGPGVSRENPKLSKLIRDNGVGNVTHLLGPRKDVQRIMASMDIATLSSWTESFPMTIAEAMACGVPCVATDVGDMARLIGETGRVVPARNPQALAEAWAELIRLETEGRRRLGIQARKRIEDLFALERNTKAFEELYQRLINGTQR